VNTTYEEYEFKELAEHDFDGREGRIVVPKMRWDSDRCVCMCVCEREREREGERERVRMTRVAEMRVRLIPLRECVVYYIKRVCVLCAILGESVLCAILGESVLFTIMYHNKNH
jgi:hypothetical protein